MKPFPPELLAAYPRDPTSTRIPDRPWWRYDDFGACAYTRQSASVTALAENPGHAARIDAEHPLPFPGVRVGQTWAHAGAGQSSVFTITECRIQQYRAGQEWFTEGQITALCATAFLLADTACPWLAPWAPADTQGAK